MQNRKTMIDLRLVCQGLQEEKNITWKSLKTLIGGFGEVITVDTVEIWDVAKIYQPNKIVAYSSDNVPFVTPKLYRALAFTTPGQSPETNPELWYNEGDTITVSASNTNTTFVANLNALKAITGMKTSDSVIVYEDGSGYSFDELDETGVKANDASAGSWKLRTRFNLGNVIAAIFTVSAFSKIYRMPNIDDTVIVLAIGDVQIFGGVTITTTEPCFIVRKTSGNTVGDFEVVSFGSGGSSGHTIKDSAGTTLPTQPVLKFGAGLKVTDGTGETIVTPDTLSTITPDAGNANKLPVVNAAGDTIGYTTFDVNQVVQLGGIDMSDVEFGESKILIATKDALGNPEFGGSISQLDKLGPPGLSTLLAETNPLWDGDEITLTGNNLNSALGENSQEYRIGSDFFLCISHIIGTTTANGSATWVRNRGQDSLTPGVANDDAIIAELETETGWNVLAGFKQITTISKKGTWYRKNTGGYLYMCIDKNDGWTRVGNPPLVDIEITAASHPILTANLTAHDFVTNGFYDQASDGTNEAASQAQEWWDLTNNVWYKRNMNGFWSKNI